jgi:hypothetical protein
MSDKFDGFNNAFKAYNNLSDAGSNAAELSATLNTRIAGCLEKLNKFLNLNEKPRPAIVENYKPEGFKPASIKKAAKESK